MFVGKTGANLMLALTAKPHASFYAPHCTENDESALAE